ncbi:Chitin-biding protein 2 [Perigonia lusca single nucleopolyhedrovirus]|uniref:Chitin-biding protein 2 n=1 Tax=Perigonia lusca single nucleopolyhedrovirus TaxID=1675865 RepID=A0A0M3N200_9ABAC|nr:Chitin-biding protein 2 [Perigonia lusca single nucleopolyhedrovirus]AKN80644.1 Chitin-biding protein 2 [Perigonia lusca single nucleopolyhedrovirus]
MYRHTIIIIIICISIIVIGFIVFIQLISTIVDDYDFDPENEDSSLPPPPEYVCFNTFGNLPHSQNCQKYFFCPGGNIAIEMHCPPQHLFNENSQNCTPAYQVDCGDRPNPYA